MELVTVTLGSPDLAFAEENRTRRPFTLTHPAAAVHPMVQSFRFKYLDDDRHLNGVGISLTPIFSPDESPTTGEVEIQTIFRDSDGEIVFPTADLIEMEISVLVVAV